MSRATATFTQAARVVGRAGRAALTDATLATATATDTCRAGFHAPENRPGRSPVRLGGGSRDRYPRLTGTVVPVTHDPPGTPSPPASCRSTSRLRRPRAP